MGFYLEIAGMGLSQSALGTSGTMRSTITMETFRRSFLEAVLSSHPTSISQVYRRG